MSSFLTEESARLLYAAGDAAHDFDHILRVTRLAVQIAEAEQADVEVVRLAALLHDLPPEATGTGGGTDDHHAEAARAAHHVDAAQRALALLQGSCLEVQQMENVAHCIRAHRFRDQSVQPQTLEARCLYDADKLDSMGAIGVARAVAYATHHGNRLWNEPVAAIEAQLAGNRPLPVGKEYTPVHEFVFKLQRLYGTLHTESARAMGRSRHETMAAFFAALDAELTPLQRASSDGSP